jgi:hypothetical protein
LKKAKLAVFNIKSVEKIKEVQRIVEKKPIENPVAFGMDVIHGYETTFPFLRSFFYLGYEID